MDKELIAMCDCPEIQDRWEPKVGDRVGHASPKYRPATVIGIDVKGNIQITPDIAIGRIFGFAQNELFYIPSIEGVLEWLVPRHWSEIMNEIIDHRYSDDAPTSVWESDIKSFIAYFMHLAHHKTWNGEAWV